MYETYSTVVVLYCTVPYGPSVRAVLRTESMLWLSLDDVPASAGIADHPLWTPTTEPGSIPRGPS